MMFQKSFKYADLLKHFLLLLMLKKNVWGEPLYFFQDSLSLTEQYLFGIENQQCT